MNAKRPRQDAEMEIWEEPLNLSINKKLVEEVDHNSNVKRTNETENNKVKRVNNNNCCWTDDECLDLRKCKTTNDNNNLKNNKIFDDVYKRSYIYENLSNTYLPTAENFYTLFSDSKFLASWYANSLLTAAGTTYLNLARGEVNKTGGDKGASTNPLNNEKRPNGACRRTNFELIRNETKRDT